MIDQSVVDLADNPIGKLTETVVGTNRLLADENHRLVATRLCWTDHPKADQLRRALEDSGVQNVVVLSESEATTALSGTGLAASSMRAVIPDDPTFALARGAAMAAGAAADATAMSPTARLAGDATAMAPAVGLGGDATAMAPATQLGGETTAMAPATQVAGDATAIAPTAGMAESHAEEPQLAYSMAGDDELLPVDDEFDDDFYDDEAETGRQRLSGRSLLISNAVVAFAVIGFASLAVAVAITVRPTAAAEPVVGHQNAAPGKFMPLLPTQQQAPVPPPPPDQPNAGYQGGIIADSNGYIPAPSCVAWRGWDASPGCPCPCSRIARYTGRSRLRAQPEWADPGPDHYSVPGLAATVAAVPAADYDDADYDDATDVNAAARNDDAADDDAADDDAADDNAAARYDDAADDLEGALHLDANANHCRPGAKHAAHDGAATHTDADAADRGAEAGAPTNDPEAGVPAAATRRPSTSAPATGAGLA